MFKELPRLARLVREATGCDGVNVVQNNGAAAGQVCTYLNPKSETLNPKP